MKVKYSLILIACFAQIIICETEYIIDIVQGSLKTLPCSTYNIEGQYIDAYGFSFTALTSGFTDSYKFLLQLSEPNYASATCYVPATKDGETQEIYCVLRPDQFPILVDYITLPTNIDFSPIDPTNWYEVIGVNPRVIVGKPHLLQIYLQKVKLKHLFTLWTMKEKGSYMALGLWRLILAGII